MTIHPIMMLAAVAGFLGGWVFYRLWRALLPPGYGREFWARLPGELRTMLETDEPAEALRQYRGLMFRIARHTGRNLWAVLVGIAPLTVFCLLFDALVDGPADLNRNPLWPYLDDFEFFILLFATIGSGAAAWRSRVQR